jgi:hypothetical protein
MSEVERDMLGELLRHSSPRPTPAADKTASARAELRREWQELTGQRQRRRRIQTFAVAASLLLGLVIATLSWRAPVTEFVPVATLDKTFGTVYVLGEDSELRPTDTLDTIYSGQAIVTGNDSGLSVAWGSGGSIRVDENTRIRFTGTGTAFLEEGRVYYDSVYSLPSTTAAGEAPIFSLETQQGTVTHLGTQYMAAVEGDNLVVSVREGNVLIRGRLHEQHVDSGQQATLTGAQRPSLLSISRYGTQWDWVARTMPAANVDGRTLSEFLDWVSRELGLDLRFEGNAEAVAHEAILRGTVDTSPEDALRLRLATAALDWRIEEGVIYISD